MLTLKSRARNMGAFVVRATSGDNSTAYKALQV